MGRTILRRLMVTVPMTSVAISIALGLRCLRCRVWEGAILIDNLLVRIHLIIELT